MTKETEMNLIRSYVNVIRRDRGIKPPYNRERRPEFCPDRSEGYALLYQQIIPADIGWDVLENDSDIRELVIDEIVNDSLLKDKKDA